LQLGHFIFCEVIFCHADIELLDFTLRRVFPGVQAHVRFGRNDPGDDDLCRRLSVDSPMELVLHGGEKALGGGGGDIVVDRGGVNVADFLVELPLAQADFPDALELFLEIFFTEDGAVVSAAHQPSQSP
jgi:hypothetical protein